MKKILILLILLLPFVGLYADIKVNVSDIDIEEGEFIVFAVYDNKNDFKAENPIMDMQVSIDKETEISFVIENLPSGDYLIIGLQDKNMNNEMDTSSIGIPREGYCISNNKKMPSWRKCNIEYDGTHLEIDLDMIYW